MTAAAVRFADIAVEACDRRGAMQRVGELTDVLAEVAATDPAVVVEIGCGNGGTLWAWRQLCPEVFAVTLPNLNPDFPRRHGSTVLLADSHDPRSRVWLQEQLAGRPVDVLHIDGDHSYDGVRSDFEQYAPLVRPDGLIILHDIANDRDPDMGVPEFWAALRAQFGRIREIVYPGPRPLGAGLIWQESRP